VVVHRRNAALAARIRDLGYTEAEVADLLNDAVEAATGKRSRSTGRYVRLLLVGTVRWPWPVTRRALEQVLGRPILELGFVPHRTTGRGFSPLPPPGKPPSSPAQPAADVVAVVGGRALTVQVPPLPALRLTDPDLGRLACPLADLYALCATYGPVGLAATAAHQAARLAQLKVAMPMRFGRRLRCLVVHYWAAAAWLAHLAADDVATIDRYLNNALRGVAACADPYASAHINQVLSARAEQGRAPGEAIALAYATVHMQSSTVDRRVRVLGHLHLGLAQAMGGNWPAGEASFDRAARLLHRAAPDPAQPWLGGVDQATVDAYRARGALSIGQYDIAAKHAQQAAAAADPARIWDRTVILLDLADAYLGMGDIEQAAQQAATALDLALGMNDAVRTGQVAGRLQRIGHLLGEWAEVPAAVRWVHAYRRNSGGSPTGHRRVDPGIPPPSAGGRLPAPAHLCGVPATPGTSPCRAAEHQEGNP
jgi:hypothetical protein